MSYTGNFGKKYIKQVEVCDVEGNKVEILLKYSARTPLLYLNMFGTDMFDDLGKIAIATSKSKKLVEKVDKVGAENLAENLTEKDFDGVDMTPMFDFFKKFGAALIATAHYPKPLAYDVIYAEEGAMLPEDFITDEEYSPIFTAIKELFIPMEEDYKKKLMQASAVVGIKRT